MLRLPTNVLIACFLFLAPWGAVAIQAPAIVEPGALPIDLADYQSPWGLSVMDDPLGADQAGLEVALQHLEASMDPAALLAASSTAFTDVPALPAPTPTPAVHSLSAAIAEAWLMAGQPLSTGDLLALQARTAPIDPVLKAAAATLVAGANQASLVRGEPFAALTEDDIAWLLAAGPELPGFDAADLDRGDALRLIDPAELDTSSVDRTRAILAKVDVPSIRAAQAIEAGAATTALALLADLPPTEASVATAAPGDLMDEETPYGRIIISSEAAHTYTDDYFVSIDLGGDDTYHNHPGTAYGDILDSSMAAAEHALTLAAGGDATDPAWQATLLEHTLATHDFAITIDVDGDDTYANPAPFTQGSGSFGGFGILADLQGADTYSAVRHAQGDSQVVGIGMLLDGGGDDTYSVDAQGIGFAQTAGIGILADANGADSYSARVVGQGLGWDGGVGVLIDGDGHDIYDCWGVDDFSDSVLPISESRPGTTCHATGWGGVGALFDAGGDDRFTTFAGFQTLTLLGGSLLVDLAGNDLHRSGEWGIATGVLGPSVLIDALGNDVYDTRMVQPNPWIDTYIGGNGEGYIGTGILIDGDGDDSYTSDVRKDLWLTQYACGSGCAFAAGTGLLIDGGGDDTYTSETGQGGSHAGVAALIDASGSDTYSLLHGSTRGQGYAGIDLGFANQFAVITAIATDCVYGILWDLDGADDYSNPVTDFGTRDDLQYWGQGEMGRGMDDLDGTMGYLQSSEFEQDRDRLVNDVACNNVTPIVLDILMGSVTIS